MANINRITLPDSSVYELRDKNANIYVVCSTAAATAEKAVSISNFTLESGMTVHVLFVNENSAAEPALKVNDEAAIDIYLNDDNVCMWNAGEVVALTYDGSYWRINNYGKIEVVRL